MEASDDFHIDATVQSQYAASPHIRALVDAYWEALNPDADIDLIYKNMIDPDTAVGFGLDVWGRIVAIGREYLAADEENIYFGFTHLFLKKSTEKSDWQILPIEPTYLLRR